MKIEAEISLDFDDVLIKPQYSEISSRADVNLIRKFYFKHAQQNWEGVPIIAANMDTVATFDMHDALKNHHMVTALHKHYSLKELNRFTSTEADQDRYFISIGMRDEDYTKYMSLDNRPKMLCIDVPSGYLEKFVEFVKQARYDNPNTVIMAGNVCTAIMTETLIKAGADIVKVGVGGGSGCLTRRMTGVGIPQLSAIDECSQIAHALNAHICADGGIVHPGDLGKAFGAGADFVMMGGVFAGHDECNSELYDPHGNLVEVFPGGDRAGWTIKFYGMASNEAMNKHYGGKAKYRSAEGRSAMIPYKGSVHETVHEFLGGLRSTMSYIGAKSLDEAHHRTTFVRVNKILNTVYEKS